MHEGVHFFCRSAKLSETVELFFLYSGMTAVKISDFNEPTNSLVHIKDEDASDEEERHPPALRGPDNSLFTASTSNKKRYNWDNFNEEERPTKKRYCVKE